MLAICYRRCAPAGAVIAPEEHNVCRTCCTNEATSPCWTWCYYGSGKSPAPGDMSVARGCIPPAVPFGGAAVMGGDPAVKNYNEPGVLSL
jgi:hypothetical protein